MKGLGLHRIMLVTDPFMAVSAACELVRSSLEQAGVAVSLYSEVELDPDAASISRAAAAYAALAELMTRVGALRLGVATGVRQNELGRLVEIVQSEERLIGLSRRAPGTEEWRAIFEQSW